MIKVTEKEYVSYLRYKSGEFDPNKISTDISLDRVYENKPDKAWWGSPVDAEYDWKKWCEDHGETDVNFDKPIIWKLEEGSKVYFINAEDVVLKEDNPIFDYLVIKRKIHSLGRVDIIIDAPAKEKIAIIKNKPALWHLECQMNYEKLLSDGIVGVELEDYSLIDKFTDRLESSFNKWLCQSIVVLDHKKIEFKTGVSSNA